MKSGRLDAVRPTDAKADGTQESEAMEMMSDTTLHKLIEYLQAVEKWPSDKIVKLLEYISAKQ